MKKILFFQLLALISTATLSLQAGNLTDNFETFSLGDLNGQGDADGDGQPDWSVLQGTAEVTMEEAQNGTQAVKLFGGTDVIIERDLSTFNDTPFFADLYVKMPANVSPLQQVLTLNESTVWFIKEGTLGVFHVLDGDGAGGNGTSFAVPPSFALDANDRTFSWARLTFRQDFLSGEWDLYINGELAAINLGFADVVTAAIELRLYGDDSADAFLDTLTYGGSNPLFTDTDKDGMPDSWEDANGIDKTSDDRDADVDFPAPDGLTNIEEYLFGTKPYAADSDGDGASDSAEVLAGSDALDAASYPTGHTPPPPPAQGTLYLYEPFDYTAGFNQTPTANALGLDGDYAFEGTSQSGFAAASLSYGNLTTEAGSLQLSRSNPWWNSNSTSLPLTSSVSSLLAPASGESTGDLWMSFLVKKPVGSSNAHLKFEFEIPFWRNLSGVVADASGGSTQTGLMVNQSESLSSVSVSEDQTYLYLVKFNKTNTGSGIDYAGELWVFESGTDTIPNEASALATGHTYSYAGMPGDAPTKLVLYLSSNTDNPYEVDELRLGDSFAAVLPGIASTSGGGTTNPEPAGVPVITPESGTYAAGLEVSISTSSPGTTIYYTTDGTTPTTASTVYTTPFTLTSGATVKAIATGDGYFQSGVAIEEYTLLQTTAAPTIAPPSGNYDYFVEVSITPNEAGSTIYYTTDGSDPDPATSPEYTAPFTVATNSTVKSIATRDGQIDSSIIQASYTIGTAELLIYEPFDYPVGTNTNTPTTAIGLTGDLEFGMVTDSIDADSITVSTLDTSANHLSKTNNPWWSNNGVSLTWDTAFNERINLQNTNSEDLWISFTAQTSADLNNKSLALKFLGWGDHYGIEIDSDTNEARIFIQTGGTKHTAAARTINPDTKYLYLTRLRVDNTAGPKNISLDLWVYEDSDELPGNANALPAPQATLSKDLVTDWGVFKLYLEYLTPSAPNAALDPYIFDELRIAKAYTIAVPGDHIDTDGDGLTDKFEIENGLDPYNPNDGGENQDLDNDGMPNKWELDNGLNPNDSSDADTDLDDDGLPNLVEYVNGMDPQDKLELETAGIVKRKVWNIVFGKGLENLESDPRYPDNPSFVDYIDGLTIPENVSEHYGYELEGTITAPISGDYTFSIAASSRAELHLGADDTFESASKIAFVPDEVDQGNFDVYPEQASSTITLAAGQKYYVKIISVEDMAYDFLEVQWSLPGVSKSYDLTYHFVSPPSTQTGKVRYDYWIDTNQSYYSLQDVLSFSVEQLLASTDFPNNPDYSVLRSKLEINNPGDQYYGVLVSGVLVPDVTGDYEFKVSADDVVEFYIGSDEVSVNSNVLIRATVTGVNEVQNASTQISSPILLTKGKRYAFEVRFKQGVGADHFGVYWKKPGETEFYSIGSKYLDTLVPNDANNNKIDDALEATYFGVDNVIYANNDFEGDGIQNYIETELGYNPTSTDSDGDGTLDPEEYLFDITQSTESAQAASSPWLNSTIGQLFSAPVFSTQDDIVSIYSLAGGVDEFGDGVDSAGISYQVVSGDFDIITHIQFNDENNLYSEGGIMLRASLLDDHNRIALTQSGYRRISYHATDENAENTKISGDFWPQYPSLKHYLRLTRQGNEVSAYISEDGIIWAPMGYAEFNAEIAYLGLYGSSMSANLDSAVYFHDIDLRLDSDGDGVYDEDEGAINAQSEDRDTDSFNDYFELYELYSDPDTADLDTVHVVDDRVPAIDDVLEGFWNEIDGLISNGSPYGAFGYEFISQRDGVFLVDVSITALSYESYLEPFRVNVYVDDVYVDQINLKLFEDETGTDTVVLPWLKAGTHQLRFELDNTFYEREFQFDNIRVYYIEGPDSDNDGKFDWEEYRLETINGVLDTVVDSHISPATIEGWSLFQAFASNSEDLPITELPADKWYIEYDLGDNDSGSLTIDMENGGLSKTVTVNWVPLNVVDHSNSIYRIKKGDTLKLYADDGNSTDSDLFDITIVGSSSTSSINRLQSIKHAFDTEGLFTIKVSKQGTLVATMQVDVVEINMKDGAFKTNVEQVWTQDDFHSDITVIYDSNIQLSAIPDNIVTSSDFRITVNQKGSHVVAARLKGSNRILDTAEVVGIHLAGTNLTNTQILKDYADGTRLVRFTLYLSHIPPNIHIEVIPYIGGAYTLDGSDILVLTADDFDENGFTSYHLYISDFKQTICHQVRIYTIEEDGTKTLLGGF